MNSSKRLLAIVAHPDDESAAIGGTLALYSRQGVRTHVIIATDGAVGHAPEGLKGYASVVEMRAAELDCAARALGLTATYNLGYRDSGMPGAPDNQHPDALFAAPLAQVAQKIAAQIRRVRPQVVITHDPIGGYRHPDHIVCNRATVEAVRLAGDASVALDDLAPYAIQRLYYQTWPRGLFKLGLSVLRLFGANPREFGRNRDIDLVSLAQVEFPINAVINISAARRFKQDATDCHSSQLERPNGATRFLFGLMDRKEMFMRALPQEPPKKQEKDLFEGVTED